MLTMLRKHMYVPFHTECSFLSIRKELLFSRSHRRFPPLARGSALSQSKTYTRHRHPKPDPSPLHRGELERQGKGHREVSHRPKVASVSDLWGKPTQSSYHELQSKEHGKAELLLNEGLQGGRGQKEGTASSNPRNCTLSHKQQSEFRWTWNYTIIRHQRGKKNLIVLIVTIPPSSLSTFLEEKWQRKYRHYSSPAEIYLSGVFQDS